MPKTGSQVFICDLPIRFDTYRGCSHACDYCFVKLKYDIQNIKPAESVVALRDFIDGKRNKLTKWCDFDIPLHWGGESDPFQPVEKKFRRSLECLKVFAETQYPFVVSTKNKLISEGEYLELIKQCNCVVQFSAACKEYDEFEKGASTFDERMQAAEEIAKYKRVIVRVQPYMPYYHKQITQALERFAEVGVYGCVFEAMKYKTKRTKTIRLGGDFVYPTDILQPLFLQLKSKCHKLGLKFYAGENRLRSMGDSLCCCGVDGLGWRTNTANLNHYLFDRGGYNSLKQCKLKGVASFTRPSRRTALSALR